MPRATSILIASVALTLLAAMPASAKLDPQRAQRYAQDRMTYLVPLFANPTPRYKLHRCERATDWRFSCRFTIHYMTGNPYRGRLTVIFHRHVEPGFTRLGFKITAIPNEPPPSLRRGLASYS